jgi:hypothetical protein
MPIREDLISESLIKIFRPLVRLLLRLNVPFRACSEALKWTYVDLATREFAIGDRQTKSRVSVITGLTRTEVQRLHDDGARRTHETMPRYHRAARVLSAWENDPEFQDKQGKPLQLLRSAEGPCIEKLIEKFSGGSTVHSVLDEVIARENVRYDAMTERYSLISASLLVNGDIESELDILATATSDLLSTIEYNLRPNQRDKRLQAFAHQLDLPASQVLKVRAFARIKGNEFLNELDQLLTRMSTRQGSDMGDEIEAEETKQEENCTRLGMGIYYFQDEAQVDEVKLDNRGRKQSLKRSSNSN